MTDLLQLVPYLLGFHPTESVVAVLLRRRRVLLTARVDLESGVPGLADHLTRISRSHRADGVLLAAYTTSAPAAHSALATLVADARLPAVIDAVHVDAGRWWSMSEGFAVRTGWSAGDLAGRPLDTGRLAAEAVYAGLAAVPDRSHAVAAAERPSAEQLSESAGSLASALVDIGRLGPAERVADAVELVARWASGDPEPPGSADLVRLGVLVGDIAARDELIMLLDTESADAMVGCWAAVVAVLPDELAVGPLCLLGLAAWVCGNGALLVRCIERADECEPDYTLTRLLAQIADQAVPPSAWALLNGFGADRSSGRDQ